MSTFAVAAFHDARLAAGTEQLEAAVWVRADGVEAGGVQAALRIWTPAGASVTALREIAPAAVDLLVAAAHIDDRTLEAGAGCWTDGPREYELVLSLPARAAGEEMLAARVTVVAGEAVVGQALIAVTWTAAAAPGADAAAPAPEADASAAAARAPGSAAPDTVAVATSDLPTGASPEPRHRAADAPGGHPCPGCGAQAGDGDRYCEACGRELV